MIKIVYPDGKSEVVEPFTFSGGEEHVNLKKREVLRDGNILIVARLDSSSEIMRLLMITDALYTLYNNRVNLHMPYLPYARQDRRCNKGDAFSLQVFAELINSQNYEKITCFDAHSSIAQTLIYNLESIGSHTLVDNINKRFDYFVSPDKGARQKTDKCASFWNLHNKGNKVKVLYGSKIRDTTNGHLVYEPLDSPDLTGKDCLIIDDICDGGMTFILLANELKKKNAKSISLYVTHGIFSKGIKVLLDAGIAHIYTTNSMYNIYDEAFLLLPYITTIANVL